MFAIAGENLCLNESPCLGEKLSGCKMHADNFLGIRPSNEPFKYNLKGEALCLIEY